MPQTKQAAAVSKPKNAIVRFISDTIAEMKKVTWLSRPEIAYLTGLVLLVAIAAGIVLGLFDWGFYRLIQLLPVG
jgi:preprotein translocase SecE subunit